MSSLASRRDDSGEVGAAPGRHARKPVDTFDLADLVVFVVSVGFALWTLAFWFALAFGIGWALAGPLWILGCVVTLWVLRGSHSDRSRVASDLRVPMGSRSAWVVVTGVAASSLTSSWGSGRPAAVAVVVGLVAYGAYQRRSQWRVDRPGAGLGVLGAGAVLGLFGAVELWYPFLAGVAAMVAWLAWSEFHGEGRSAGDDDGADRAGRHHPSGRPPALTLPVVAIGGALAAYLLFTIGYNPDHGHYLNKSLHYAEQPGAFEVRDYMFGVPGVDHIPRGTILNSLEILIGFVSAVTGIGHVTLTYHVMAPAAAFLLPVGLAWTAREFGARRPDLVAATATVAMVLFAETHDSRVVLIRLAEGKLVAGMVALPIFIGAAIRWARRRDGGSLLLACAAGVATYGISSTAGIALIPAAGAAMAAGALATRDRRTWSPAELARGAVPLAVVLLISGIGFVMHRTIDTGLDRFPDSYSAWLSRLVGRSRDLSIDGSEPAVFVLLLSVAIVVLAGRTSVQRWYFGIASGGLLLVVYNPWLFETLWGSLGISGLSWRAAWALPLGLAVGLAVDALHGRDATIWDGRLGAVLLVAVFVVGVSPLTATDQGPPRAFQQGDLEAAEALIAVTPEGGRFLAPQEVETVAIALTDDRYPSVVRPYFLADLSTYDDLPPAFAPAERMALYQQLVAGRIGPRFKQFAASAASADPAELLVRVQVDAVCLPRETAPGLARVLREDWTRTSVHPRCNVFVRNH
ncbi:MAG: hypothetical protein ACE367_02150 [Acidimicrobiales bacterium]